MHTPEYIDFEAITALFREAHAEGRNFLYEYEVYTLLARSGAETPPRASLLVRGARPSDEELAAMPGDRAVLKIVSPTIVHKTEVGGVRIVPKTPDNVRSAMRRMLYEVPENYAAWIERHPEAAPPSYRGLSGQGLVAAVSRDVKGILQVQFMPPDSDAFGNELIVGLRRTREFGMVLSAGLGGTDTELYAQRFRKGQAIVAASTALTDGESFFEASGASSATISSSNASRASSSWPTTIPRKIPTRPLSSRNSRSTPSPSRTTSWCPWTGCAAFPCPAAGPWEGPWARSPISCIRNASVSSAYRPRAGISGGSSSRTSWPRDFPGKT